MIILIKKTLLFIMYCITNNTISYAQDYKLLTSIPIAKAIDIKNWNFISKYQYGVAGTRFVDSEQVIGFCLAKRNSGGPWFPIDGKKHTLCGQLYLPHHGKYVEITDDDGDVDMYIFPDSAFIPLLVYSNRANGAVDVNGTVLGEISFKEPGNKIENDGATYFQSLQPLEFQSVGIYGAWVSDGSHENQPEIHPIEEMWQSKKINATTTVYNLFTMHDNQGRFGRVENFASPQRSNFPPFDYLPANCDSLPWIKNPQLDTFYLPFEIQLPLASSPFSVNNSIEYTIETLSANNVNSKNDNANTRLLYKGNPIITIKKQFATYPSISFDKYCIKNGNTLIGYVRVSTSISDESTNGAHLFLKVTQKNNFNQISTNIY
jgi:hypothetical protein